MTDILKYIFVPFVLHGFGATFPDLIKTIMEQSQVHFAIQIHMKIHFCIDLHNIFKDSDSSNFSIIFYDWFLSKRSKSWSFGYMNSLYTHEKKAHRFIHRSICFAWICTNSLFLQYVPLLQMLLMSTWPYGDRLKVI